MAKINGIVYMITGLIIILVSWKVDRKKLLVFIYAGYIMIVVGVVKLFFIRKSGLKEKVGKTMHPSHSNIQQTHQTKSHRPVNESKRCLRCSNVLSSYDKFCNKCGARIIT